MNLQRFIKLSILLIIFSGSLMAQGMHHHGPNLQLTDEVKAELNLTPEQLTQLDELKADMKMQMEALHENSELDRKAKMESREAIMAQNKISFSEILTTAQSEQLAEYRKAKIAAYKKARASVDVKAMRAEMQAYQKENVQPVMKAQREKLEANLTLEEKNNLDDIRQQIQIDRLAYKEKAQARKEAAEKRKEEASQRSHKPRHKKRARSKKSNLMRWLHGNKEAYTSLQTISVNHQDQIDELIFEEISSEKVQWETERKAIVDRYVPEELTQQQPRAEGKRAARGNNETRQAKKQEQQRIAFLLMSLEDETERGASLTTVSNLGVYPNPAVNTTTAKFELAKDSQFSIVLTNEKGSTVKVINAEEYKMGENSVELDLSDVQNGTYYLMLKGATINPTTVKVLVLK